MTAIVVEIAVENSAHAIGGLEISESIFDPAYGGSSHVSLALAASYGRSRGSSYLGRTRHSSIQAF